MTTIETTLLRNTSTLPDDLAEQFRRIAGLIENWNGYGGPAIEPDCIEDAVRIAKMGLAMGLPAPGVAPGGDGGIGIEWAMEQWELSIDIAPGAATTYALDKILPDGAASEESDGTLESDDQIRSIFALMV